MTFEAYLGRSGGTAVIRLAGDLTDIHVSAVRDLVDEAIRHPLDRLQIEMAGLRSIAPSGVRCLAYAQQTLPPAVPFLIADAGEPVRRALAFAGFDSTVTMITRRLGGAGQAGTEPTVPAA